MKKVLVLLVTIFCSLATVFGQLSVNNLFNDNMVIQRNKAVKVWGSGTAGEKVLVEFAGQSKEDTVEEDGSWQVVLDPMPVCNQGQMLRITMKEEAVILQDVLIGDVWVLTGQSNMEFDLKRIRHGDVEIASANFPEIRLLTIPAKFTPEPESDFEGINEWDGWYGRHDLKGYWLVCTPQTVPTFSAMGYVFGRRIHMASQVPIGLIDVSVGGTTVESWTSRGRLLEDSDNQGLIELWDERIRITPEKAYDRNNPGAPFNGMMNPLTGAAVNGIIFNQGFNNALGDSRPKLYTKNLQVMITGFREVFNDEKLPFGIISLSAGGEPQTPENFHSSMMDAGCYIREAQLQAYKDMKNVGFVAAYDEQVNWYHPQKKQELGERMARWALATSYGYEIGWEPALLENHEIVNGEVHLHFDKEVVSHDGRPIYGMALAGKDKRFYQADARYRVSGKDDKNRDILDRTVVIVSCKQVKKPMACRYAWARNPIGNLVNNKQKEIPVPSFRTDTWDWPEAPFAEGNTEEFKKHREVVRDLRR